MGKGASLVWGKYRRTRFARRGPPGASSVPCTSASLPDCSSRSLPPFVNNPPPTGFNPSNNTAFGRIGLGCVTFGREIGEPEAFALMDHAIRLGVRLFDTAAAYGNGASERIIGRWFADRRPPAGTVVVATKVLPPFSRERIADSVTESRRRLAPAPIGVLYLHKWDETAERSDTLESLARLAGRAEVPLLGASNFTAPQLRRALARQAAAGLRPFRVVQNNHNFAVRDVDPDLRHVCAAAGIAVVTYSPLGAGFLAGKHGAGVVPGSRLDVMPGHQRIYFTATTRARLAWLEAVAQRTGVSPTHLALAWALHQPGPTTVLVGGRSPAHLDQAVAALQMSDAGILTALDDCP